MLRRLQWLWISFFIIALDQWSKAFVLQHLALREPVKVNTFFNLFLDFNKGAAFSFLGSETGWQMWAFGLIAVMVSISIIVYFLRTSKIIFLNGAGLALILGGGIGNLIDRIHYGYVIDFISWHYHQYYWPTFNIADSAVCIGVVLLFLGLKK
jgi:signal peptidase II